MPKGLSDIEAASLPETFFTVWTNVFDRGRLQAGETLLVQGGTSGIGVTAIQLGQGARRPRVIVTAGSADEVQARAWQLGADAAINYKEPGLRRRGQAHHRRARRRRRARHGGGRPTSRAEVQCAADDGRIVIIAVQGGVKASSTPATLLRRRLTITGSTLRPRPVAFKTAIARVVARQTCGR